MFSKAFRTLLIMLAVIALACGCAVQSATLDPSAFGYTETRLLGILEALESKDKDAVLALFSMSALQEDEDIEEEVDEIMAFYEGTHGLYEGTLRVDIQRQDKNEINGEFWVTTESDEYLICFTDQVLDENPLNIGLHSIQMVKASELADESEWRIVGDESLSTVELWP